MDEQSGTAQIPLILSGKQPDSDNNLGSGNYSKPPVAIAVGGGITEREYRSLRDACKTPTCKSVPWFRPDMSKIQANGASPADAASFGKMIAIRIKERLNKARVTDEGKEWSDEEYLY
jgi:hypothetical protein